MNLSIVCFGESNKTFSNFHHNFTHNATVDVDRYAAID